LFFVVVMNWFGRGHDAIHPSASAGPAPAPAPQEA
jgi:hypothetical protein